MAYVCTYCEHSQSQPVLYVRAYSLHRKKASGQHSITVSLLVLDRRFGMSQMEQTSGRGQRLGELLRETYIDLSEVLGPAGSLHMKLEFVGEDGRQWQLCRTPDHLPATPKQQSHKLNGVLGCDSDDCQAGTEKGRAAPLVFAWFLESKPDCRPQNYLQCVIEMVHLTPRKLSKCSETIMYKSVKDFQASIEGRQPQTRRQTLPLEVDLNDECERDRHPDILVRDAMAILYNSAELLSQNTSSGFEGSPRPEYSDKTLTSLNRLSSEWKHRQSTCQKMLVIYNDDESSDENVHGTQNDSDEDQESDLDQSGEDLDGREDRHQRLQLKTMDKEQLEKAAMRLQVDADVIQEVMQCASEPERNQKLSDECKDPGAKVIPSSLPSLTGESQTEPIKRIQLKSADYSTRELSSGCSGLRNTSGMSGCLTSTSASAFSDQLLNERSLLSMSTTMNPSRGELSHITTPPGPMFSTYWQVWAEFTSSGGILCKKDSDVGLVVPEGAVEGSASVTILSAIDVDVEQMEQSLGLSETQYIVTPMAEYWAGDGFSFQRPVCIKMKHCLPANPSLRHVHVYCVPPLSVGLDGVRRVRHKSAFSGSTSQNTPEQTEQQPERDSGEEVADFNIPPEAKQLNNQESLDDQGISWDKTAYFELSSDGYLYIFTDHFSGYFCTYCKRKQRRPTLCTLVGGDFEAKPDGQLAANVTVHIWDERLKVQDFRKKYVDHQKSVSNTKELELLDEFQESHLYVRLKIIGKERDFWGHTLDDQNMPGLPVEKKYNMKRILGCSGKACHRNRSPRPISKEWAVETKEGLRAYQFLPCVVDISHVTEGTVPTWEDRDETERMTSVKLTVTGDNSDSSHLNIMNLSEIGNSTHSFMPYSLRSYDCVVDRPSSRLDDMSLERASLESPHIAVSLQESESQSPANKSARPASNSQTTPQVGNPKSLESLSLAQVVQRMPQANSYSAICPSNFRGSSSSSFSLFANKSQTSHHRSFSFSNRWNRGTSASSLDTQYSDRGTVTSGSSQVSAFHSNRVKDDNHPWSA